MEIEEKVLKLIKSSKNGILQNELWKKAKIDSSKCSRILAALEKEGKISREKESKKGVKTYLIKYIGKKEEKTRNFKLLLIGDMFSPCTGCALECEPEKCVILAEWVYGLEKEG
ncbi:MAG: MarR family transcriptional regulator [Candidatus Methanoperedens sp.]|nr:MarR family transcriptional regulator [Candidatus Methanoperedens sp.]MCZ7404552.1 MarR family transcriptional regulator [Candidatus Methanoperedens sp.]